MAAPLSSGLFLLGGAASAAYAVVRHSSDRKNSSRPSSEGFCPATPSTPYPRSAASWLRVAGSSSPSKASVHDSEQCRSPAAPSSSVPQEGIPMRALEAGSLICFYTSLGELVTVKPEGKAWVLHACLAPSPTSSESSVRLPYFPAEAVFVVTRRGSKIGFRSLGAEGRSLQAVKAPDAPHRVANHNFGSWESWEVTSSGLVNLKYRHKVLGLEIKEVRVVAREDIRKTERQHLHTSRSTRTQVKNLEHQLADTEKRLQEMVTASQRQTNIAQHEIEGLQQQLSQAISGRRMAEADALRRGATLKQLEHRLGQLSSEKDNADDACDRAGLRMGDLELQIKELKGRQAEQLHLMQQQHSRELASAGGVNNPALQRQLETAEKEAADAKAELRKISESKEHMQAEEERWQSTLQGKDAQIQQLLTERDRLEAALASSKGQINTVASPAATVQATPGRPKSLVRSSVDSATLRGLRRALEEANSKTAVSSPAGQPPLPGLPARQQHQQQHQPEPSQENRNPATEQASPLPSSSPDALAEAAGKQEQHPAEPQSAPPAQRNRRWQPPAPVRAPTGLFAMLNPGAAGSGPLHDLLKSADNSPRSSYPTPRILTPDCTPKVAEARVSDTVVWKTSQDSSADDGPRLKGPASSQASAQPFQPLRSTGRTFFGRHSVSQWPPPPQQTSHNRHAGRQALQERQQGNSSEHGDRTRLVQHFGYNAEDVEHMAERYLDEDLPGAVQVSPQKDPRPRLEEFALLAEPSTEDLMLDGRAAAPSPVAIVVQGHEAYDDEITLAASGSATPPDNVARQAGQEGSSGQYVQAADSQQQNFQQPEAYDPAPLPDLPTRQRSFLGFDEDAQSGPASQCSPDQRGSEVEDGEPQSMAHPAGQPQPSSTPHRIKLNARVANAQHGWTNAASPSHSMGSEESGGAKLRRSSFLGRPLAELDNLW